MSYLRLFRRLAVFGWLTGIVVLRIAVEKYVSGAAMPRILTLRQRWAQRLLPAVGVRLEVEGDPPARPCLLVSNHRSYLDPILILQLCHVFPVSKSELAGWPLLGHGAAMAGVLFLKRQDSAKRKQMLHLIARTIESGYTVLLFPEGTTSDLPGTLPFRKSAFLLAERAGIPVMPVAIRYAHTGDYWVGNDSFLRHVVRRFRSGTIRVTVVFGPVMPPGTGEQLMTGAVHWIESQLHNTSHP